MTENDSMLKLSEDRTMNDVPGQTILSDTVLETIAGIATREVEGVYMLGKGALRNVIGKVTGTSDTTQGVSAEVGKKEVAIDLEMIVEYGYNIKDVANQVRKLVADRIQQMTGLKVKEINIKIHDIHFKTNEAPAKARVE
ncbi:MAG: Asp23/Gls24 family envelope stress response protein [Myxococcota bacterium]|nr:Asp23/Gls24 family envelope stress response protein [Myxococcota bacterium]